MHASFQGLSHVKALPPHGRMDLLDARQPHKDSHSGRTAILLLGVMKFAGHLLI